jgi:hypothetical protein
MTITDGFLTSGFVGADCPNASEVRPVAASRTDRIAAVEDLAEII